jgi:hypothetical protein
MADAVCFISWESYTAGPDGRGFFQQDPLTFNSAQPRLHQVAVGDSVWLVSRHPDDKQYYFVCMLRVAELRRNDPAGDIGSEYGQYGIVADRVGSYDLARKFPAETLLRSLAYETGRPIRHGASVGQSIQSIRLLNQTDVILLNYCLNRVLSGLEPQPGMCALWTKCDRQFADYFSTNWTARRVPQAFLLYDSPPALPIGAPVFIHSDQCLRLLARFRGSEFVASYKRTTDADEQQGEMERCWNEYRARTIAAPERAAFEEFWGKQDSIRSLIVLDNFVSLPQAPQFKEYGRALEWGYPQGVGWRPLDLFQTHYLMNLSGVDISLTAFFLGAMLK